MPATFIGYKKESRRGTKDSRGKLYEDVAIVRGATTIPEAILASGMPLYGSAHPDDAEAFVTGFVPEEITEDGTFFIRVVWATPSYSIADQTRTFQGAEWTHSLVSQRVVVDLDGVPIGSRNTVNNVTPLEFTELIHEGATIGVDVQVPYSQVEIIKPLPSAYPAASVHALVGKVNDDAMDLDGVPFAAGEVILLGARARRLQALPANAYDVRYLFAVGRSAIPDKPAFMAVDDSLYTGDLTITLQYGYAVMFVARKADESPAENQDEIAIYDPDHLKLHRLYEAGDMSALAVE